MTGNGKEDFRVQKTKGSIRQPFEDMICEMDYEQITIKALAERARINRKTFYLHYDTIDHLLRELQNEIAEDFIKRTHGLEKPRDMDKITREFFLFSEGLGKLGERITCVGSYKYISRKMTNDVVTRTWKPNTENYNKNLYIQNIVMSYVTHSTLEIYKQWVLDGREIPLEEIINIATQLVCNGVNGLEKLSLN